MQAKEEVDRLQQLTLDRSNLAFGSVMVRPCNPSCHARMSRTWLVPLGSHACPLLHHVVLRIISILAFAGCRCREPPLIACASTLACRQLSATPTCG